MHFAIFTIHVSLARLGMGTIKDFVNQNINMIASFLKCGLWHDTYIIASTNILSQLVLWRALFVLN